MNFTSPGQTSATTHPVLHWRGRQNPRTNAAGDLLAAGAPLALERPAISSSASGPVEGLNLGFLNHRERHRATGRLQIKADGCRRPFR
jgi:hypothetical protein